MTRLAVGRYKSTFIRLLNTSMNIYLIVADMVILALGPMEENDYDNLIRRAQVGRAKRDLLSSPKHTVLREMID